MMKTALRAPLTILDEMKSLDEESNEILDKLVNALKEGLS